MNQKIKAEWVAALRSGQYKQGEGALRDKKDHYCCLGVLCEIARKHEVDLIVTEPHVDDEDGSFSINWEYDGTEELLPDAVVQWAELDSDNPEVQIGIDGEIVWEGLANVNDRGTPFPMIAEMIENSL
jgi:hypothetical protein